MIHANLKALILTNQSQNHRLMRFNADGDDNISARLYYGADILSRPDGTWELTIRCNAINQAASDLINLITPPDFVLKKVKTRTYKFNGDDFLAKEAKFSFQADNSWTAAPGSIIYGDKLKEKTKALHALTRRVRKKVQPQLRLLGPEPFARPRNDNGYPKHIHYEQNAEINALIEILDGKNITTNICILRDVCDMGYLLGHGSRYGIQSTSEFQPKKVIDKILRRVSANKLAILEKYDERNRKAADRPKTGTRRAA